MRQKAQLSQRDRATRYVSWNLVNRCTQVRKIIGFSMSSHFLHYILQLQRTYCQCIHQQPHNWRRISCLRVCLLTDFFILYIFVLHSWSISYNTVWVEYASITSVSTADSVVTYLFHDLRTRSLSCTDSGYRRVLIAFGRTSEPESVINRVGPLLAKCSVSLLHDWNHCSSKS